MVTGKKINQLKITLESLDPARISLGFLITPDKVSVSFTLLGAIQPQELFSFTRASLIEVQELFKPTAKDFHAVSIVLASPEVTLVPEGIFDTSLTDTYLESVFGSSRAQSRDYLLEESEAHCLFRADKSLISDLEEIFPQLVIRHIIDPLIKDTLMGLHFSDQEFFRLHQEANDLYILVFKGKELVLFNAYHIGDPTDVVYHTLNTIEQIGVDYAQSKMASSGSLHDTSEAFALLQSYCPLLSYKSGNEQNPELKSEFILYRLPLCES